MCGKGDKPRPKSISEKEFKKKFEQAFGSKKAWWETEEHQQLVEEMKEEQKQHSKKLD